MFHLYDSDLIPFEKVACFKAPTAATSEMETCFTLVRARHPNALRIGTLQPDPLCCGSNFILLHADLVKLNQLNTWVTKQRGRPIGKKKERKS